MSNDVAILLVEDDQIDVMAVQRAFKTRKIANELLVAKDGLEALEIMRGEHPDLKLTSPYIVLLDLNMPRMDGLKFLETIRDDADLASSIVFVMTTSRDDEDRASAYRQNVAGYILKSDFDNSFMDAIVMLEAYWRIIEFPD